MNSDLAFVEYDGARDALVQASLRVISSRFSDHQSAYDAAEAEYSDGQFALAARRYVEAVNALPERDRPVGWSGERASNGV